MTNRVTDLPIHAKRLIRLSIVTISIACLVGSVVGCLFDAMLYKGTFFCSSIFAFSMKKTFTCQLPHPSLIVIVIFPCLPPSLPRSHRPALKLPIFGFQVSQTYSYSLTNNFMKLPPNKNDQYFCQISLFNLSYWLN